MHNVYQRPRKVSTLEYNHRLAYYNAGESVAQHMAYIYSIVLYDKMGFSFKKLNNFAEKLRALKGKFLDDNDNEVTAETLLTYAEKKGIELPEFVVSIPVSDKMNLANLKRGVIGANEAASYGLLRTLLLVIPILKESYKFSNAKIEEFLGWVKYVMHMYNTKLPKERGNVFSDEYIRQIFIEDEHWDIKKGENVV